VAVFVHPDIGDPPAATLETASLREDAYYGICVAPDGVFCPVLYEPSDLQRAHLLMEEIVCRLKHYWVAVDYEPLELYEFSSPAKTNAV